MSSNVKDYEFYVSMDGSRWQKASQGQLDETAQFQIADIGRLFPTHGLSDPVDSPPQNDWDNGSTYNVIHVATGLKLGLSEGKNDEAILSEISGLDPSVSFQIVRFKKGQDDFFIQRADGEARLKRLNSGKLTSSPVKKKSKSMRFKIVAQTDGTFHILNRGNCQTNRCRSRWSNSHFNCDESDAVKWMSRGLRRRGRAHA